MVLLINNLMGLPSVYLDHQNSESNISIKFQQRGKFSPFFNEGPGAESVVTEL